VSRISLLLVVVCVLILGGAGAALLTADHSVDRNIPGKTTGAGRNSLVSPEASR
jgi:hypothetical protein